MGRQNQGDSVDDSVAQAVGLFLLSDQTLQEAAKQADVTPWELEDALESIDLDDRIEIDRNKKASETIDELFDDTG